MTSQIRCEDFQMSVSELLDGELDVDDTLPTFDHVLRCDECRSFYRRARRLDLDVAQLEPNARPHVSSPAPAPRRAPRSWWRPASAVAAAAVVVLMAWGSLQWFTPRSAGPVEVQLGEHGRMSEQRFVDLAVELLQADVRDRSEMMRVLEHVRSETSPGEGLAQITASSSEQDPVGWSRSRGASDGDNVLPRIY